MKITLKTLKGHQLPLEVQPDMTVSWVIFRSRLHGLPCLHWKSDLYQIFTNCSFIVQTGCRFESSHWDNSRSERCNLEAHRLRKSYGRWHQDSIGLQDQRRWLYRHDGRKGRYSFNPSLSRCHWSSNFLLCFISYYGFNFHLEKKFRALFSFILLSWIKASSF